MIPVWALNIYLSLKIYTPLYATNKKEQKSTLPGDYPRKERSEKAIMKQDVIIGPRNLVPMLGLIKCYTGPNVKPFISQNLIVKITIYTHTIDKFKQITKTLWAI